MPKPRSKRQAIRDERKQKRREKNFTDRDAKRQRLDEDENEDGIARETNDEATTYENWEDQHTSGGHPPPEREFFGMLSEEDQEWFRSADQDLDADEFDTQEDRDKYLAGVFTAAQGKELKIACSQSCSRLMERLIIMSNTRQKKQLFEQFATHFLNLMQHRFASHCCETLLLHSAPIVTRELGGDRDDLGEADEQQLPTMEELFLLTLDELEGQLGYLMTDRFASHTLRVLLIILSGRPLEQSTTKSLIHSKKKEQIAVPWTSTGSSELNDQLRPVPSSFTLAAKKIIADSTSDMDATALRIMATHPTGNPVLQLLLDLDISLNGKVEGEASEMTLLWKLLPGAPASLKEATSPASDFISAMLYDKVGSRLLETLITQCPGKLFKALFKFNLGDRIQSLVRNDIASYAAIRVLTRVGKEDLIMCVRKILPEVGKLLSLSRFNVIKTLFERCQVREATSEIDSLLKALVAACGSDYKTLVPKLCIPPAEEKDSKKSQDYLSKNQAAIVAHGCQLTSTLLSIRGLPSTAVQTSLLALPSAALQDLATSSAASSHVLVAALASRSQNKTFHKVLVVSLKQNMMALALSDHGSKVVSAIVSVPSKGDGVSLPFHLKEQILGQLEQHEQELRDSYHGRRVWRAWQGDLWKTKRTDWISWAKEVDIHSEEVALPPWKKKAMGTLKSARPNNNPNPNMVEVNEGARKRKRGDEEDDAAA
ncbi:pumilio-family RNA binding repeat domain-containing protein [Pseudomassariella vexata]|uniref:Nucleolar protein 9 n=1 Tax=Pseudomassariella vexata TaxID=1141098 RepID=A0A1Y2DI56_9PEZI|nr:pumilio-family RNA binding repeat domain-containing protein [Pseudomassariella vexata]ORY58824.1 pumilio-family RNA binding repeat domain-containing protein [Pseudomassariella vexata]